jgi:hypothetical protein
MNPNTIVNSTKATELTFSLDGRNSAQNGRVDKNIASNTHGTPAVMVRVETLKTHINLTLGSMLWIIVSFCS